MNPCVVDASVVAAAFFEEKHADKARAVLSSDRALHAPDLIYAELANVIWKRRRRGEIDQHEAAELLADVLALPLRITPCSALVAGALQLAVRTDRTAHDCLYVVLAVKLKTAVVSGDRRLVAALGDGPMAKHIAWIGGQD